RQEMQPILELIEYIPDQSRVECLGTRPMPPPVFWFYPLDLNCPALVQLRTDSFGGFGFPETAFNPVKFRPDQGYARLRHHGFDIPVLVQQWDYVLWRGEHPAPNPRLAETVATAQADFPG